ncbi:4-hydroxy-tetrahydrodipicolinate synthase [Marinobacterium zhoushanense]|uniref:4-hydroxy-tetrahydrodipicolinate synthase n=1 Tax=Marinobacterium zhoushanense TaxID=1679163 RepID=A0ABQ1KXQ9_9GAMM|nr:4-hydroxy-tetrahydrodipicolinate synthase [Marinobacterium zhoushanense]GGC10981.1 4-hydroxy-tetrahydrodipicolinate synthase [Marinobacterium zhoushanense]
MFEGSLVAMITPFSEGRIDYAGVKRCIDLHLEHGTEGLVIAGTTGEAPTLSKAEYQQLLTEVCRYVAGRIPVIAGASSYNPVEALALIRIAETTGVDALLCAAGYYNRPNQQGLYEHFRYLHDNSSLPLLIYNIPPRTIVDIQPETMARLAQLERVIGVKDACRDLARPMQERVLIGDDFCYLSGDDCTAVAYNAMGGHGIISVIANLLPAQSRQLQDACRANDFATATAIQHRLTPMIQALGLEPNPAGIKYACSLLGLCTPECRLPMVELQASSKEIIRQALQQIGG